jgi:hypothetical protein
MRRLFTKRLPFPYRGSYALLIAAGICLAPEVLAQTLSTTPSYDATNVYYRVPVTSTTKWVRAFIDTDRSATTGYRSNSIGANYLIENDNLYRYSGSGPNWVWSYVKKVSYTVSGGVATQSMTRADLGAPTSLDLFTNRESTSKVVETSAKMTQTFGIAAPVATSDATNVYYKIPLSGTPTWVRLFLDADANAATGFRIGTIGAAYLVENDNLYRYSGTGTNWAWTYVKKVTFSKGSSVANVTVARADLGSPTKINLLSNTEPPNQTSATVSQTLTVAPTPTPVPEPTPTPTPVPEPTPTPTPVPEPTPTPTPVPEPTPTPVPEPTGPTYYLSPTGNDVSAGTQAAPWRTIQKAANTVSAGDTVVLLDGTYEEASIGFNRSGTASKPITFKAQNKWKAVLSSTSGCNPGFSINASYITVKDIRFTISPKTAVCGTYTSSNVHIRAWNTVNATPSNPTTGSAGFHADGLKLESGLARAVSLKSNQDFTIIENIEADNALELFNSKNSIIRSSVVTGQDKYGVSIIGKGGVRNAQFYNNVVHNKANDGYGIYLGGYSCDTCFFDPSAKIEAYNSVAYNNVVINEGSGNLQGLVFAGAKDSAFFNNVVIGGAVLTMQGGYNTGFRASTTNPTLVNNIFMCKTKSAFSGTYSGTFKVDSNNFYQCANVPAQTNTITGDPLLANPASDWHLQPNSPALNRGAATSITGYDGVAIDVSHDKNGVVRSIPWDLGIYNY